MDDSSDPQVLIIGAGPSGLCLASELGLAGVRCTVLEVRTQATAHSKALGLQARTLELLSLRGIAAELIDRGNAVNHFRMGVGRGAMVRLGGLDSDFRQVNICPQYVTEEVLEKSARNHGAVIERGLKVTGVRQTRSHVFVKVADINTGATRELRAEWVVGCDGSNSVTRECAGIAFPGREYPYRVVFADVRLTRPPAYGASVEVGRTGIGFAADFGKGRWRIGAVERLPLRPVTEPVTLQELSEATIRVFGRDMEPHDPLWSSRAILRLGHAATYRDGRVLLAGDAIHVQAPLGGQGLNLAVQDVMNLGWKLAAVVNGHAAPEFLISYEKERRPVVANILRATDNGIRLLMSASPPKQILRRFLLPALTTVPPIHAKIAGNLSGIATSYRDISVGGSASSPLVGRRLPDAQLDRAETGRSDGTRLFDLFRSGKFVLLDQADGRLAGAATAWADRVTPVVARVLDRPELSGFAGILCRPDGYCAWAGDADPEALRRALGFWCGHPGSTDAVADGPQQPARAELDTDTAHR